MPATTEELAPDGVEAQHLAARALDEADVGALHLVETLVAAQVEFVSVGDAATAAAYRRLVAVEEPEGGVEGDTVDAIVEAQPQVVVGIERCCQHGLALKAIAYGNLLDLSGLHVEEDDAVVDGAQHQQVSADGGTRQLFLVDEAAGGQVYRLKPVVTIEKQSVLPAHEQDAPVVGEHGHNG